MTCVGLCTLGNDIGSGGAVAMGPHLGKLVNIHTLDLTGARCDALCWVSLVVDNMLWYECIVRGRE